MSIYMEAVEVVLKSQSDIYGSWKMTPIAHSSGWSVNDSLRIVSVGDEEASFRNLWRNIEKELGIAAVVGSKLALIRFISGKEKGGVKLERSVREHFMREVYG